MNYKGLKNLILLQPISLCFLHYLYGFELVFTSPFIGCKTPAMIFNRADYPVPFIVILEMGGLSNFFGNTHQRQRTLIGKRIPAR
jgi:hypothetical protein